MASSLQAFRGNFLHCLANPGSFSNAEDSNEAIEYVENGTLLVENGQIVSLNRSGGQSSGKSGSKSGADDLPKSCELHDYSGKLLVPGFVDTHVHYPQVDVIASYGTQLLEWLDTYTFPAELKFADAQNAQETARFFLDELLRNGTTTALVFGTVHKGSVDAFFTEAQKRKLRMICGKVMMDRNAPPELCDTAQSGFDDSKALIKQWHNKDRLGYAVTPRFAPTSSDEQLQMAGKLLSEHDDVHLHTHLSENGAECDWVASLFPDHADYLSVYEHFGLLRKRSVFAHSIHLSHNEWKQLSKANSAIAHCPTSNLFIGSGLFDLRKAEQSGVRVGLGTDIGGGDSFSMLRTINEAYKIQQLQGNSLKPEQAFYMATLGGAEALDLQSYIGNFQAGKEADFVVLDQNATPLISRRCSASTDWRSTLFTLMMLGDDRCIEQTFILGEPAKPKPFAHV